MTQLIHLVDRLYRMTMISVRLFDAEGVQVHSCGNSLENDPVILGGKYSILRDLAAKHELPVLLFEENVFLYGAMSDRIPGLIIWGPITLSKVEESSLVEYSEKNNIDNGKLTVHASTLNAMCGCMALLYSIRTGLNIDEEAILRQYDESGDSFTKNINSYIHYIMERAESGHSHMSRSAELMYFDMIRRGDVESLKSKPSTSTLDDIGRFAHKKIKFYEYMVCTSICLSCRAAIEGGVTPEAAYLMSDVFLQRLEACTSVEGMLALHTEVKFGYAQKVNEEKAKQSKNIHVEKCKAYISNNLNVPFTLEDLAKELGVNKTYLSRRFSQEEGIGIKQFARVARIHAAANMLKFSDLDIQTIATYLCFTSQSHFGSAFKEILGVTPLVYRSKESLTTISPSKQK
jgi:AraC-like DNA-binding protein